MTVDSLLELIMIKLADDSSVLEVGFEGKSLRVKTLTNQVFFVKVLEA